MKAKNIKGETTRYTMNELDLFIAENVFKEKQPTKECDPLYAYGQGELERSKKRAWQAHHDYEQGDVTTWIPCHFSTDESLAQFAWGRFLDSYKNRMTVSSLHGDKLQYCIRTNKGKSNILWKFAISSSKTEWKDASSRSVSMAKAICEGLRKYILWVRKGGPGSGIKRNSKSR